MLKPFEFEIKKITPEIRGTLELVAESREVVIE